LNKEAYGAGKPGLNLQQVGAVVVPIPGYAEVEAIMSVIAAQFDVISAQEEAATRCVKQSTAQRQNILRAAFAGQLVPQDPNDEPASVLLERIRSERAAQAVTKKPRGRRIIKEAAA
jgi:type I restriction enzyme S subunit